MYREDIHRGCLTQFISGVKPNDLLRLAFQAHDQIATFLFTHTGVYDKDLAS